MNAKPSFTKLLLLALLCCAPACSRAAPAANFSKAKDLQFEFGREENIEGVSPDRQSPTPLADTNLPIKVPEGAPPLLDGKHSPGEWANAAVKYFADGSKLFLMRAEDHLFVGIKAAEPGMIAGNVFIFIGGKIQILHASAALGTAIYEKDQGGWRLRQDFSWRCRSTANDAAARAERSSFLENEGWLAANGRMGTPNELEYQIKITEAPLRLAVVYLKSSPPYEKVPWPSGLQDATILPTPNGLPPDLAFSTGQWGELIFSYTDELGD